MPSQSIKPSKKLASDDRDRLIMEAEGELKGLEEQLEFFETKAAKADVVVKQLGYH